MHHPCHLPDCHLCCNFSQLTTQRVTDHRHFLFPKMCLAQDRGASAPKAVSLRTPSKHTIASLLLAGHTSRKEVTLDSSDATLTTVGTEDESQHSHRGITSHDGDVEVALAHSFDLDLFFDQVPTGGLISLPRANQVDTRSTTSSPSATTPPLSPHAALFGSSPPLEQARLLASPISSAGRPTCDLHVECSKPPTMLEASYSTPKASCRGVTTLLTPPPTPKHARLTHAIFFDQWPEHLMIPRFS